MHPWPGQEEVSRSITYISTIYIVTGNEFIQERSGIVQNRKTDRKMVLSTNTFSIVLFSLFLKKIPMEKPLSLPL